MTRFLPLLLLLALAPARAQTAAPGAADPLADVIARLDGPNLLLPDWGPYSTRYAGVSHVADAGRGLRFDLTVAPGFYRRRVLVPDALWESGYHPWTATPDLGRYSYRYELQGQDGVVAEATFARVDEHARLVEVTWTNAEPLPQSVALHLVASLEYPADDGYAVALPPGAAWTDGVDYESLHTQPTPRDSLTYDAWRRGEVRGAAFVGGRALGRVGLAPAFGRQAGDRAEYRVQTERALADAVVVIRARATGGDGRFQLAVGGAEPSALVVPAAPERADAETGLHLLGESASRAEGLVVMAVPVGPLAAGEHRVALVSEGGGATEIDGLALVEAADVGAVAFAPRPRRHEPEVTEGPVAQSVVLRYADLDHVYGIAWAGAGHELREYVADDFGPVLRRSINTHWTNRFVGEGEGFFLDVHLRPIALPAAGSEPARDTLYALVASGSPAEVEARLRAFHDAAAVGRAAALAAPAPASGPDPVPSGEAYRFGQERLAAAVLTNVTFPTYTRGQYVKHHVPGRQWLSVYTWDSGFTALGAGELDEALAVQILNTYLTPPGDPDAFVHHGSPVPVQAYVFHELWNRTQSRTLLEHFYPRLRRMYLFLTGQRFGSTTDPFESGLLATWDYFYNSGGWDDYPAQYHVNDEAPALRPRTAPVVTTAHAVRVAKILAHAARELGLDGHVADYEADAVHLTTALHEHAWDSEAGYFSYVVHNEAGRPSRFLRTEEGVNFNMGLDGASPLVGGATTPDQTARLVDHLSTSGRLWTPVGLSAVNLAAPYYSREGYWNGAVWMPHQWFFWRALLDVGEADLAWRVADTALGLWEREVRATHNTYEHFVIETGRGAGWHQFGGLSTPVLAWFSAYHRTGRLTVGLDGWVERAAFGPSDQELTARLRFTPRSHPSERPQTVIARLAPGPAYRATWDGAPAPFRERLPGLVEVDLPGDAVSGELVVRAAP